MKKGSLFSPRPAFFITLFLLLPLLLPAQTTSGSFEDGDPLFTKTIKGPGTMLSDIGTLAPVYGVSGQDSVLDYRLSGLEWSYPYRDAITSAEDIDSRTLNGQTLYLITDGLGRRVFEFNANTSVETWSFPPPQSATDPTDEKYLNKPVDAFIYRDIATSYFKVVITDQDRNRVITVDKETSKIDWKYGDALYREGNGYNQLRSPEDAERIVGTSEYIIADKGNNRVIIVDSNTNNIVWELGSDVLKSPVDIQYNSTNNLILITDQGNHRVILVDRSSKSILWQFGRTGMADSGAVGLKLPTDADLVEGSNNVIICDAGNERIIEVNQTGQIVWQFHRRLKGLRDADRIENGRTLAVYENYPVRLAYTEAYVVSGAYDLGEYHASVFDSLFWKADTVAGVTSAWFQLRTAESAFALDGATWYGPNGKDSYYTTSGSALNPVHTGHRWYQFRALLKTSDPLQTAIIRETSVVHHYYDVNQTGAYFYTPIIAESSGKLVSQWNKMSFKTNLAKEVEKRAAVDIEVRILNAKNSQILERFTASKLNEENEITLSSLPSLKGIQSIYLVASLSTGNSSMTPIMDNWKVTWDAIPTANSSITFTDKNANAKSYYRATTTLPATESLVDSLYILLRDPDLEPFRSTYKVTVRALGTTDSVKVDLKLLTLGGFFSAKALPILINSTAVRDNNIMEAQDRDHLVVSYRDSLTSADVSQDTILVVKNSTGLMTIENARKVEIARANFGDTLFVRIKNESDHNLDPNLQEALHVSLFDNVTLDREELTLYEVAAGGRYNTGEFVTTTGVPVRHSNNGIRGNGEIESMPGHSVAAEYVDNFTLTRYVLIPTESDTSARDSIYIFYGRKPGGAEIGPNPYHAGRDGKFRLRVGFSTDSLNVSSIEIFNLAGERVRTLLPGTDFSFRTENNVSVTNSDSWWDMKNDSGQEVGSGTYWAKVNAETRGLANLSRRVNYLCKFVIIR
ncbi:MAG TPA: hypothetical protein PKI62_07375 [bacterium]|nr:hypothetical protein [bacterium]HPR87185.1 hypothetical protein [bacterium]